MSPNRPIPPGLAKFWNSPVEDFATLPGTPIPPSAQERHRIYSLLLMSLIVREWNGNKCGEIGDYGVWRANQVFGVLSNGQKVYKGGTYLGHNIAALAVDAEGRIMDFDFNHNEIFDSTVEHAESRLVRRVFALNQVYDPRAGQPGKTTTISPGNLLPIQKHYLFATAISDRPPYAATKEAPPVPYSTLLKDVTIYTSLESCAQCSGIMCLASVKEIVYLQWDQGQFLIGNMMWQATTAQASGFIAPRPIRGDEFGFEYFKDLNKANDEFSAKVGQNPFYRGPDGKVIDKPSVTSFLCTDLAYEIYLKAHNELRDWTKCEHPDYRPIPSAFSNAEVLGQAHDYLAWTGKLNNRGTPHRV